MEQNLIDIYDLVEHAIDNAFEGKMNLKFYNYLKESKTATEITDITTELDEYIKGGSDNEHKQLREGYGHIPKPQARKIKIYLYGILEDAWRYSRDRRPGRRKKQSK